MPVVPNRSGAPSYYVWVPVCPYCSLTSDDVWLSNDQALVLPHPDPIAPGHAVVIPRRHVSGFYSLDVVEQRGVWTLVKEIQKRIEESLQVTRFHVGFEDSAKSQDHAQVHVVPQALDEQMDLPAGIEWVSEA